MRVRNLLIPAIPTARGRGRSMYFGPGGTAEFEYLQLEVRRILAEETFEGSTDSNEVAIVGLGGRFDLESTNGTWSDIGFRANVFTGMPWTVYLPIHTKFAVTALSDCEIAFCYCRAEVSHPEVDLMEPLLA